MSIVRPSQDSIDIQAAEERLEREAYLDLEQAKLDQEQEIARLKFSVNLRQKALIAFVKGPASICCIVGITLLALFGKPVPTTLENFLDSQSLETTSS